MDYKKNITAFTLIEMLVSIIILGIISSTVSFLLIHIFDDINKTKDELDLNVSARTSINLITRTLKNSSRASINITSARDDITFMDSLTNQSNRFYLDSGEKTINMVLNTNPSVVSKGISAFQTIPYDSSLQVISGTIDNTNNDKISLIFVSVTSQYIYKGRTRQSTLQRKVKINAE